MASNRKKGERFAKLPLELLMHPAVTTLPHAAFRVLTVFAAGYTGINNGALAGTDTWMKKFGLNSKDTIYAARDELLRRGLIEITRKGIKTRKMPTLYAITWQAVNYRDGDIMGRFSAPSHTYRQWRAPERTKKKVPDCRKPKATITAEFQSDGRTSISPIVGPENVVFSPTSPTKTPLLQSDHRAYLRLSEGLPGATAGSGSTPVPDSPPDSAPSPIPKKAVGRNSKLKARAIA